MSWRVGRERRPLGLVFDHRGNDVGDCFSSESPSAAERLVEHAAKGPDVRALVDGLAAGLFWRHVGGCTDDHAQLRGMGSECGGVVHRRAGRFGAQRFGETEVQHLRPAVGTDFDVRGLEVAMNDALLVRRFEPLGDLLRDGHRLVNRDRAVRDELRQVLAFVASARPLDRASSLRAEGPTSRPRGSSCQNCREAFSRSA